MSELFDFSGFKIRASSAGKLMTAPKSEVDKRANNLSETAKTHLIETYIHKKHNRRIGFTNKYVQKGLMVEEDGLTLYSRIKKHFFIKNEETLENPFFTGTPDTFFGGTNIFNAERIIDIKCSWDIVTFFKQLAAKKISDDYYWQLQVYMCLTGAKSARLAFCLIDTPETLINDEKRKLMYKMNVATTENEEYILACEELERFMTYPDFDLEERLIEFDVDRDEAAIQSIYPKVIKARMFLEEFQQKTIQMRSKIKAA